MFKIAGSIAVLLLLALLLPITLSFPVYAGDGGALANIYVNGTTGSAGYDGSSPVHSSGSIGPKKTIVQGINTVADNGTVHVASGIYNEYHIDLQFDMNLVGDGALTTIIDGGAHGYVLEVSSAPLQNNTISGFTIQNGAAAGSDPGGGIYVTSAHILTINDCAIINNSKGPGSGMKPGEGGGLCNDNGHVYMNRCTVSGNTATGFGGGIANLCDLPATDFGKTWLTNCTISGNTVTGALAVGGGLYNGALADVTLLNVTIADNHATSANSFGGGFSNSSASSMYFTNCIVANNTAGQSQYNNSYNGLGSGINSLGHNIEGGPESYFHDPTDQLNNNPMLGPLQNNGGPTSTMAITSSSPAYNRGTNDGAPATDQRGVSRPQAGICDVGAYEFQSTGQPTASVNTSLGLVNFSTNSGSISGLVNLPADSMPCSSGGFIFPFGMFSYSITNLAPGATVIVTITTPIAIPMGAKVFKCQNGSLTDFSANSIQIDANTFRLTVTDGGPGDADGVANGTIVDPCGPAFTDTSNNHRGSTLQPMAPQGPAPMANIAVQSASLSTAKVAPGAPITVTANIANKGTANGSTQVKLYVNGQEEAHQGVTLSGGGNTPIKFTVSRNEPGSYSVYVGSLPAGTFEVDRLADPNLILYISGALLLFALAGGIIFMAMRRPR
ncbi:MAG: choice-of-anchor U domain-containing protein [Dehalococcoidia bacterium]